MQNNILGLDLGTNSIGWAIVNDGRIESLGTRSINHLSHSSKTRFKKPTVDSAIRQISQLTNEILLPQRRILSVRFIFTSSITIIMFTLALLMPAYWQYWLNIGIGGLYVLTNTKMFKDNDKSK